MFRVPSGSEGPLSFRVWEERTLEGKALSELRAAGRMAASGVKSLITLLPSHQSPRRVSLPPRSDSAASSAHPVEDQEK